MSPSEPEGPETAGVSMRPDKRWLAGTGLVGILLMLIVGMVLFDSCQRDAEVEEKRVAAAAAAKLEVEARQAAAQRSVEMITLATADAARAATEAARSSAITAKPKPKSDDSGAAQVPVADPGTPGGFVAPSEPSPDQPPHEEPPHEEPPEEPHEEEPPDGDHEEAPDSGD